MDKILYEGYRKAFIALCNQLAQLARFAKWYENGIAFEKRQFAYTAEMADALKKEVLMYKEKLGFEVNLDSLANNKFDGFEIRDGRFIGSISNVRKITDPWYEQFTEDGGNNYLFEVAVYIQLLAFPKVLEKTEYSPLVGADEMIVNEKISNTKRSIKERLIGFLGIRQNVPVLGTDKE